jgi:hypothetical protein
MRRSRPLWALAVVVAAVTAHPGHAATPTRSRAHVVLAVVENGLDVYHQEFRATDHRRSPATWLSGYPSSAQPLRLHLSAPDLPSALRADDATWRSVRPGRLYYVPGTRVSGLVYLPTALDHGADAQISSQDPTAVLGTPRPVVDGNTWHGTGVTSVAAGRTVGTCPDCDIVLVAADNQQDGLRWAAQQPWIDIISNSWGGPAGLPTQATTGHPERAATTGSASSYAAAGAGKLVVFASGNGLSDLGPTTHGTQHSLTWDSPFAGPPWVLTVGAATPSGQPTDWHNIPVDLIAQGEQRRSADETSLRGYSTFNGTSCSAPVAAGVVAEALLRARARLGDPHVGPTHGLLHAARWHTALAPTGALGYPALLDAARAVAGWQPFDPSTLPDDPFLTPTTPAAYAYEGYGLLDRNDVAALTDVLVGRRPLPARPELSSWERASQQVRQGLWGPAPLPPGTAGG